jgi:CYTH domain-containing protein
MSSDDGRRDYTRLVTLQAQDVTKEEAERLLGNGQSFEVQLDGVFYEVDVIEGAEVHGA